MTDIIDAPWQFQPITKRLDKTFEIATGDGPYHVCPKDVDPAGAYDFDEVSAFWESLSADDPQKLTEAEPEETVATMEQAKASKRAEIARGSDAAEAYAKQGYAAIEISSWPEQEAGARAILGDEANAKSVQAKLFLLTADIVTHCVALVTSLAEARGVGVKAFAQKICGHADLADLLTKQVWLGEQASFERQLAEAVATGDIAAVQALEIAYSLPPKVE